MCIFFNEVGFHTRQSMQKKNARNSQSQYSSRADIVQLRPVRSMREIAHLPAMTMMRKMQDRAIVPVNTCL